MGGDAKQAGQALCQPWDAGAGVQLNQDAIQTHLECTIKQLLRLRSAPGPQNVPFLSLFCEINGCFLSN